MLGKTTAFLHVNESKLKEFRRYLYDALEEGGSLDFLEFQMKRKNREVFVTEHSVAPLKDEQGKLIGWVSVVRDISERKKMEDELRKSRDDLETRVQERTAELAKINEELKVEIAERQRMERELKSASLYARSLIEASLDPLVTINAGGKIMDVNRAMEFVTGVSRANLIGSDFFDYFTEPDKARAGCEEVFLRGAVRDYPLAVRHTSGLVTDVIYNATVYKNAAGEVQGVFASARDITERKQAEEELRRSEEKLRQLYSQLVAAQENERRRVARELHDGLQQILAGVKFKVENFVQIIRNSGTQTETKPLEEIVPLIQESVREIRRIQMNLRPAILDDLGILATISWFCREYGANYSSIHIEKKIEVQEKEVPEPLKMVIYRILQEGLTNISKHTRADLVHLSLRKADSGIELVIQDNGQGFDLPQELSVENSRGGMGLVSMRERAEHSGGSFAIESAKGKGTVLRAAWPS
jgi:PAS domain S-box-containing protein